MDSDENLVVEAFIEIPKYSANKYEYDHDRHVFRLDRTLYSPIHYPADYGFIPDTLAEDGDPLDILVLLTTPTFPGCLVEARVIGALSMEDEKGVDTKILGVSLGDPRFNEVRELDQLPAHIKREIGYFFTVYKDLEGKPVQVEGWHDRTFAVQVIEAARDSHRLRRGQMPTSQE
ncbi:inorganic diphosphatase [Limnochorda pilosa]|uniref:Inorganic pyrophosphatase n=1 Tax=Limnochorda pilosa TaxID=1555112 RepID=A0A0K2SHJ7_LIMPI|nr:inorganic diphosphatase [Limnochorda pilosa]BAS26591.1 inorganic pyrophosphatase [Limnochorda pilosa]